MQPFETLTYHGQIRRLRRLVDAVLPNYDIYGAKITLLQYEDNAVYHIVAHSGEQFVLRISAANGSSAIEQLSEMQWLTALRHEANLLVPEPVQTVDGKFLITVEVTGVPEPRHCVLFHWIPGKPPAKGLGSDRAKSTGIFTARLHQYAEHVIDFDDCAWGHYLLDIASLLEPLQRRVASNQRDYLVTREAYFTGYTQVRGLPLNIDAYLQTFKVLRDMGVVNFILSSKNARVREWGGCKISHAYGAIEGLSCRQTITYLGLFDRPLT